MGRTKNDAIKENGAKKKTANNKGARAQAQKIAERAKAQDTKNGNFQIQRMSSKREDPVRIQRLLQPLNPLPMMVL